MELSMAEAAKKLGISVSAIRRYEKEFDLRFPRTERGRCALSELDLTNLRIIVAYRQQGMPLDEIKAQLRQNAMVSTERHSFGPDIQEVLSALIKRQDDLERVVQQQQSLIESMRDENRHLLASNERMQLLLAAPKDDGAITELRDRIRQLEQQSETAEDSLDAGSQDELMRKLQRRLLDLEATVASQTVTGQEDDEGILEELSRAIQQQVARQSEKRWWEFWK